MKISRKSKSDEFYTPFYAVEAIIEYLPKDKIYWLPFDKEWSAFTQVLKSNDIKYEISHIDNNEDFFTYEPKNWDIILSNPPFSIKDKILERAYSFNKPFLLLLPVESLQGVKRFDLFQENGLQLIVFDQRITYHENPFSDFSKTIMFGSAYFCHNILKENLIFKKLNKFERKLFNIEDLI